MKQRPSLQSCIAFGVLAWGVFAAFEIAAYTLGPLLGGYYDIVEPFYWRFTVILLVMYLGAGALLGAMTHLLAQSRTGSRLSHFHQEASAILLVSFYAVNLGIWHRRGNLAEQVALATALVILALLGGALLFPNRFRWARIVGDPWIAASLLLGAPVLSRAFNFRNSLLFLVGLVCIAFISRKYLSRSSGSLNLPLRQLTAAAAGLFAVLAATAISGKSDLPVPTATTAKKVSTSSAPNVLWVVMDTVRADHLSLYGYSRETTPNLDRFARGATVYRQAKSSANWTLPSHASMFTGLYARAHGANIFPHGTLPSGLQPKFGTVAELLTSSGYVSMAEIGNSFIVPEYGLAQGFQLFDARGIVPWAGPRDTYLPRHLMRRIMDQFLWTQDFDRVTRRAEDITSNGIRLMDSAREREQPFFLFVNYMDAHEPYVPPHPYDTIFPGKNRKMTRSHYLRMLNEVIARKRRMTQTEYEHYVSQYDGAIRYIDDQLARLFARLQQAGVYDKTLIVVTSDHGEAFGERNYVGHRQSLYQDQIFVPLVIKYPGQHEARTDARVVSNVDLMPTVVAAVGLTVPKGLHGQDLLSPVWESNRAVSAEAYLHQGLAILRPDHPARQYSIFRDKLKLISNSDGTNELYDLSTDPTERKNIYRVDSTIAKTMRETLNEWLDEVPMQMQPPKKVNTRTMDRLKALGYVQ